ncbi:MAG: hypothetical protein ABIV47_01790 [Roseiflexaceae bacterium]
MAEIEPAKWPTMRGYLACYALYIGLIIPGTLAVFLIWRNAILVMLAAFLGRSQANQLIYLASMVFLGLGAFILVMAAEPYLRNGLVRRQLMRRFRKLAIPLVIAAALALLVLTLL